MRLLVPLLKLPLAVVGEDLDVERRPFPASPTVEAPGESPACPLAFALLWARRGMLGEAGEETELEARSIQEVTREGWIAAWRLR